MATSVIGIFRESPKASETHGLKLPPDTPPSAQIKTMRVHAIDTTPHVASPMSTLHPTLKINMKVPTNSATYLGRPGPESGLRVRDNKPASASKLTTTTPQTVAAAAEISSPPALVSEVSFEGVEAEVASSGPLAAEAVSFCRRPPLAALSVDMTATTSTMLPFAAWLIAWFCNSANDDSTVPEQLLWPLSHAAPSPASIKSEPSAGFRSDSMPAKADVARHVRVANSTCPDIAGVSQRSAVHGQG
mmetsp:Transcript_13471/g.37286  ORF Transcript_13471/g.37286 Transcript_13471/m.37286 type:complete len:246 (+) Transcript_13471:351-1088(+)